ncbi:hypothetical protein EMIT0P2_50215 [Pseudomonas sp. IT-P2]
MSLPKKRGAPYSYLRGRLSQKNMGLPWERLRANYRPKPPYKPGTGLVKISIGRFRISPSPPNSM